MHLISASQPGLSSRISASCLWRGQSHLLRQALPSYPTNRCGTPLIRYVFQSFLHVVLFKALGLGTRPGIDESGPLLESTILH